MIKALDLDVLYARAVAHRREHGCDAWPYAPYRRLFEIVKQMGEQQAPQRVLEVGTATGLTALTLHAAAPAARIETIEMDAEHVRLACENIQCVAGDEAPIQILEGDAKQILSTLESGAYDLIFFDGYAPESLFLQEFERLMSNGGTLVSANGQLRGEITPLYQSRLEDPGVWSFVASFDDTQVYRKK